MKRVFFAGSTNDLGGFVCQELKAKSHFVRGLFRSPEKHAPFQNSRDEVVEARISQPKSHEHVGCEMDGASSSVGIAQQQDRLIFRDVDYQGNKTLLDVALRVDAVKKARRGISMVFHHTRDEEGG